MKIFLISKPLLLIKLALLLISSKALAIESPQYAVLFEDDVVEYRQYEPYIVAETVVNSSSSFGSASNEGFMRLFGYITGDNSSQTKLDMTSPVQQATAGEEIAMTSPVQQLQTSQGWRVAFMLPSKFSIETAPLPTDERIVLREVPGQLIAVVRYSGRWTERNYEKHKGRLLRSLEASEIESLGTVEFAAYNAPFVLPFLRRNEVMIEVKSVPRSDNSIELPRVKISAL
jgi:hypothetical protein|tara:strand:+ start:1261 stop:1950 length:690 start_codon:yes stop_codon:yes gene_type:complete